MIHSTKKRALRGTKGGDDVLSVILLKGEILLFSSWLWNGERNELNSVVVLRASPGLKGYNCFAAVEHPASVFAVSPTHSSLSISHFLVGNLKLTVIYSSRQREIPNYMTEFYLGSFSVAGIRAFVPCIFGLWSLCSSMHCSLFACSSASRLCS